MAGINGRGGAHIDGFAGMDKDRHLIDPDSRLYDSRPRKVMAAAATRRPAWPTFLRRLTTSRWTPFLSPRATTVTAFADHGLARGKDVYVEKPISHNVFEGRKCVEAAQKYGRVVQHGTQNRSSSGRAREVAAVQSGKYGKLRVSKGYCCKPRWSIGEKPIGKPPAGLDFNLWLGPAREQPYHGNLVHYNWHWFWETGNGDIGNQGVHEMDVARWAIAGATLPTKVWSLGGRFLPDKADQGETPNMLLSVFEYPECLLVFETRGLVDKEVPEFAGRMVSNEYYTTEGVIRGGKFYPNGGGDPVSVQGGEASVTPGGPFGAFITAMRSRNPKDNNCDAETPHYSAALCHLGNIFLPAGRVRQVRSEVRLAGRQPRGGRSVRDDQGQLEGSRHSAGPNDLYQLGRQLTFDSGDRAVRGRRSRQPTADASLPSRRSS
ncbi:MAG: gfo/Idh/MocA family oxidoreductase [Pirellulaceae bacterium]